MRIGLREANQRFSHLIRRLRSGETIVLTDRGQPLAILQPIGSVVSGDELLKQLAAEGVLRPASKRGPLPDWKPRRITGEPLSRTIREDRDSR